MRPGHESRHNKRLVKQIEKASERRERLLQRGKLSLPSGQGILSIVVSRVPSHRSKLSPRDQHKAFLEEAYKLQQERLPDHQNVITRRIAAIGDMRLDFGDPEITDIIMIGHGSISNLWTEGGTHFDWRLAAKAASSLKQGKIEQRMCGNFPKKGGKTDGQPMPEAVPRYSVPLGTFAVSVFTNLTAAVAKAIPDTHPGDHHFQPVYAESGDILGQILALNEQYAGKPPIVVT
jgi:hypothetical protein